MDQALNLLSESWDLVQVYVPRILLALLVLGLSYYIGKALARIIVTVPNSSRFRQIHKTFFMRLIIGVSVFIGFVISLNILGLEKLAMSLLAGGGITAIVLGFAFREIGENLIAGCFLAFSRPFNVGDLIRTEELEGEVMAVELRYTHLRTSEGADIFVPSGQLFNKPVVNYTRDRLRQFSATVGIDYANDAIRACDLLTAEVRKVVGVLETPAASVGISSLEPGYVCLKISFWIDTFDKQSTALAIRSEVLNRCREQLLQHDFTVSANTTANVEISGRLDAS